MSFFLGCEVAVELTVWAAGLTKRSKPQNPFPKIVDGALTSHQVPASELSFVGQIKYAFWRLGWHMRQPNLRFAIKTGVGVAVLASAAFIPGTRPLWLAWRGEWALISCASSALAVSLDSGVNEAQTW